jgi:amino acid transporter
VLRVDLNGRVLGVLLSAEAAAVFSEEARLPRRTVPVATYASLAIIGAAYALASWAMSVHYGDGQVAAVAAERARACCSRWPARWSPRSPPCSS